MIISFLSGLILLFLLLPFGVPHCAWSPLSQPTAVLSRMVQILQLKEDSGSPVALKSPSASLPGASWEQSWRAPWRVHVCVSLPFVVCLGL